MAEAISLEKFRKVWGLSQDDEVAPKSETSIDVPSSNETAIVAVANVPTRPDSVSDAPIMFLISRPTTAVAVELTVISMIASKPPNAHVIVATPGLKGTSPRHMELAQGADKKSATETFYDEN